MADKVVPGPVEGSAAVREAVCIHTRKIFDSCRDKDCVEDLRFYPTASAMELLSGCQMVRGGTAELLIKQRQCHIFHGVLKRNQVERLKDESDHTVPVFGGFGFAQVFDKYVVQIIISGIVVVEDSQYVE